MGENITNDSHRENVVVLDRCQYRRSASPERGTSAMTREEALRFVSSLNERETILLDALLSFLERKHPQAQIPLETSGKAE